MSSNNNDNNTSTASSAFSQVVIQQQTSSHGNSGRHHHHQPLQKSWNDIKRFTKEVIETDAWRYGAPEKFYSVQRKKMIRLLF